MSDAPTISSVIYDVNLSVMDRQQLEMLLMVDDGEDSSELVRELYDLFKGESGTKLDRLDAVCEANNLSELRKMVHFIAGSAGNLGLNRLCAFYRGIERAIDEGSLTQISDCAEQVRSEFVLGCEAFGREFGL